MRCHQGSDYSAFAMADKADFLLVDFLPAFQVAEGSLGIAGKVFRRCAAVISSGFSVSSFIEAKHGYALSRQVVCEDEKRTMSDERFIAVVGPGTTDENGRGKRPWAGGKSERARK